MLLIKQMLLINPSRSLYLKQLAGYFHPLLEISTSTHGMKLKVTPVILLDKRSLMTSSLLFRDIRETLETLLHGCFSRFLNRANGTKSRKTSL